MSYQNYQIKVINNWAPLKRFTTEALSPVQAKTLLKTFEDRFKEVDGWSVEVVGVVSTQVYPVAKAELLK